MKKWMWLAGLMMFLVFQWGVVACTPAEPSEKTGESTADGGNTDTSSDAGNNDGGTTDNVADTTPDTPPADEKVKDEPAAQFALTSPVFENDGNIPAEFGCTKGQQDYQKPSIPLIWTGVPKGTRSFVLLMDDPDKVAGFWIHWLVLDITREASALKQGASNSSMPTGARELGNSFGAKGYGGPCPPNGNHTYRIRLFAMPSETTEIDANNKNGQQLGEELMKKALGVAELKGNFPGK
jgi:Raf kinase inhibitor-like YbhB/YbcL family protein